MTVDDEYWPSLAPIRTSTGAACTHESNAVCKSQNVQESSHGRPECSKYSPPGVSTAHFDESERANAAAADNFLTRPPCCCYRSKLSCVHFFLNCFSCAKRKTSPGKHRCIPTCMRRSSPSLQFMPFLFPAASIQSFHSSPTAKAQLSGAFPRTLSGKIQHYASPRTPGSALNRQSSGQFQHFSSPSFGANEHYLSTPRMFPSGKVQNFSGAIPSPRTPFGSSTTSPSSARRQKPATFTLIMPPAMANQKKAADQPDEPTSPHVTCIGRVRRQTHCKELLPTDMINPRAHRHDTRAKKEVTPSKKPHCSSDLSSCRSISCNEATTSSAELSTIEACTQRFGRRKLHNLHRIHGFRDEADVPIVEDRGSLDSNQGDDTLPAAFSRKDLMHLEPQSHGRHLTAINDAECIGENMRSLPKGDQDPPANVRIHSNADVDGGRSIADSTDALLGLHTTCNLEILDRVQHETHQSQCPKTGLPASISETGRSTETAGDHCLLLLRCTSSRRLSEADRGSVPCILNVVAGL